MESRCLTAREKPTQPRNLLLARDIHYCRSKHLTERIATLYGHPNESVSEKLFLSKELFISKKLNRIEAHKKMVSFCKQMRNAKALTQALEEETKEETPASN